MPFCSVCADDGLVGVYKGGEHEKVETKVSAIEQLPIAVYRRLGKQRQISAADPADFTAPVHLFKLLHGPLQWLGE